MLKKSKKAIFVFLFFLSLFSFSQTKDELKKQKKIIEEDIKKTTELLNKTKKNKQTSLSYLKALEKKIKSQGRLLQNLNIEIKLINSEISTIELQILENQSAVSSEEKRLSYLKHEYSKMIYSIFIKKGNRNDLMFIISSEDFNQALKRVQYLKQYASSRKNQEKKILQSKHLLKEKENELEAKKRKLIDELSSKNKLMYSKEKKIKTIQSSQKEKQELIKSLAKSEHVFKRKIQEKRKRNKELDDKIRKIIEEEIRKAKEKHTKNEYALTPEALALSEEFVSNKGGLPWPLSKGVIVQYYGKQNHPVFPGVETFNNGIDIATDKNTTVRTVFDGFVSRIFFIKGSGKAVLINHGEYFSVYSGLEQVYVKTGDRVLSKENIGMVLSQEAEGKTELHFEIWKGYEKQDPSKWLFNAY